jgi:hypothetical protein
VHAGTAKGLDAGTADALDTDGLPCCVPWAGSDCVRAGVDGGIAPALNQYGARSGHMAAQYMYKIHGTVYCIRGMQNRAGYGTQVHSSRDSTRQPTSPDHSSFHESTRTPTLKQQQHAITTAWYSTKYILESKIRSLPATVAVYCIYVPTHTHTHIYTHTYIHVPE